jgi:alkaline phosphatase D
MYRSVRVNQDLELWLPESRDHRSPNDSPDGPSKSIWGNAQKQWLMKSLLASNAAFKVIVNPNPIVGPDRKTKKDNHSNLSFATESLEFRRFLKTNFPSNVISVCGDRHWQYHSVDPESGLHEFGCGAASDQHAGGSPGLNLELHRFHRVKGGFLTLNLRRENNRPQLRITHHDVLGREVHGHSFAAY